MLRIRAAIIALPLVAIIALFDDWARFDVDAALDRLPSWWMAGIAPSWPWRHPGLPARRYEPGAIAKARTSAHRHGLLVRVRTIVAFDGSAYRRRAGRSSGGSAFHLDPNTAGTRGARVPMPGLASPMRSGCATASEPRSAGAGVSEGGGPRRLHPATRSADRFRSSRNARRRSGLCGGGRPRGLGPGAAVRALAGLLGLGAALLAWWRFRYTVEAGEIVIESGSSMSAPSHSLRPVQDIAIEQRLLERLFGTAKVKIENGGAAAKEQFA